MLSLNIHVGLWLLHCHKMRHNEVGQNMIFKVGGLEDWGQPPENFPRCGSFGTSDAPKEVCPKYTGKEKIKVSGTTVRS